MDAARCPHERRRTGPAAAVKGGPKAQQKTGVPDKNLTLKSFL
jgi:hypothetical protein